MKVKINEIIHLGLHSFNWEEFFFSSKLPHIYSNPSDDETTVAFINTPVLLQS